MTSRFAQLDFVGETDPRLAPTEDLEAARRLIESYEPARAAAHFHAQLIARAQVLALIAARPADAHRRSALEGHLTASALLVDAGFERALLTHHRKLNRWLQLGGHCDGDANLAAVALRECTEESGIAGLRVLPEVLDIDIHPIPERSTEPAHLHYDTRFVVVAPSGAREVVSDESHELRWFAPEELASVDVDASVRRLFELVFAR